MITINEFYFIRHGQTDDHDDDPNIPLNATGLEHVKKQVRLIKDLNIKTICSSPLRRAIETAKILNSTANVEIKIIDSLKECTTKIWKTMTNNIEPDCSLTKEFFNQVFSGVKEATERNGHVLIVSHVGIHYALCKLLKVSDHQWMLDNCGLVHFRKLNQKWCAQVLNTQIIKVSDRVKTLDENKKVIIHELLEAELLPFSFKQIDYSHPALLEVIAPSIGNPTVEKIQQILNSYKNDNYYIIGCFIDDRLIAIIGIELISSKASINHISVLEEFRSQGIAKQLIQYVIEKFSLKEISAETDEESVGFYHNIGFICKSFKGNYGIRYECRK